jgi:hypothetical protein
MSKKFADVEVYKPELQILANDVSLADKIRFILKTSNSIVINICEYTDLLKFCAFMNGNDWFEPITERKILQTGHYANIDNKPVYVDKMIAPEEYVDDENEIKIKEMKAAYAALMNKPRKQNTTIKRIP